MYYCFENELNARLSNVNHHNENFIVSLARIKTP